ncbi:hypothetical protein [Mycoplasmopsis cynos]|uniref:hypothetical protein n=1 Tax=Mycoplasmopsis cynos TaxID=171284 RepID=UPI0022032FF7|nr:hypothetical protein [Mycoplasmopsis cynos]UWV81531.1 hypothetical protein NW065_06535 [Mycoplasmopsis cynos]UWV92318.1 hypothetical protein NWE57_05600 [Mycoplasmopsis cynos]
MFFILFISFDVKALSISSFNLFFRSSGKSLKASIVFLFSTLFLFFAASIFLSKSTNSWSVFAESSTLFSSLCSFIGNLSISSFAFIILLSIPVVSLVIFSLIWFNWLRSLTFLYVSFISFLVGAFVEGYDKLSTYESNSSFIAFICSTFIASFISLIIESNFSIVSASFSFLLRSFCFVISKVLIKSLALSILDLIESSFFLNFSIFSLVSSLSLPFELIWLIKLWIALLLSPSG